MYLKCMYTFLEDSLYFRKYHSCLTMNIVLKSYKDPNTSLRQNAEQNHWCFVKSLQQVRVPVDLQFSFPHCRNRQGLGVFTEFFFLGHRIRIRIPVTIVLSSQHTSMLFQLLHLDFQLLVYRATLRGKLSFKNHQGDILIIKI